MGQDSRRCSVLTLRPLRPWDALFCWRLDRDAGVRAVAVNQEPPTWWGHARWMARWLFGSGRGAWIATKMTGSDPNELGYYRQCRTEYVGLVRVQRDRRKSGPREAIMSVAVLPQYQGRGYASAAIAEAVRLTPASWGVPTARIRADNKPSIGAFAKAGFEMVGARDGLVTMQRTWIIE